MTSEKTNKSSKGKNYYFVKDNVSLTEYKMYKYVCDLNIVNIPKLYSYDKENQIMITQRIPNETIAYNYGENPDDCPTELFNKIRETIHKLYYDAGIEYPDITGYNFIEYQNKIWIIDFEHAKFIGPNNTKEKDPFVEKFIYGLNGWNPKYF
jgi:tRNA A-37 threonylcarbamoyl transferase component Bud32